uniref:Uncharacterized protein n=1 Tax=Arundo donax TaxID=35708 RepID=A0A0A9B2Y9_ARUDO
MGWGRTQWISLSDLSANVCARQTFHLWEC